MQQYLDLCKKILNTGQWVKNERTGVRCLTIINHDLEYDTQDPSAFPILTTRNVPWKAAIAELLGYIQGYSSAADFRELGCKTWDANANENSDWLASPNRKGVDDMGRVYGVQGRSWQKPDGTTHDQLAKIIANLTAGVDDRGEILTYYNPGEFELGCLRPCMHTFQFSKVGGTLHMHAFQRSCDVPLGLVFNMIQCWVLLRLVARACNLRSGTVYHKLVNAHIYENQIPEMIMHVRRKPDVEERRPQLLIHTDARYHLGLKGIESVRVSDFSMMNYRPQGAINYPFSV